MTDENSTGAYFRLCKKLGVANGLGQVSMWDPQAAPKLEPDLYLKRVKVQGPAPVVGWVGSIRLDPWVITGRPNLTHIDPTKHK